MRVTAGGVRQWHRHLMTKQLGALTGLSGVAALWVFVYHLPRDGRYSEPINWLINALGVAGHLGVELFFLLSGFVLSLNYSAAGVHRSLSAYGGFLWRRLARIYPVHAVMLAVFVLAVFAFDVLGGQFLSEKHSRPADLWESVLLLHAWDTPLAFPWNGPSWSISAEWGAYLLFPFLILVVAPLRNRLLIGLLTGLMFMVLFRVHLEYSYYDVEVTAARLFVCFTAGCLMHRLYDLGVRWRCGGIALTVLIFGANVFELDSRAFAAAPFFAPLSAIIVLGLASGGTAASILESKWMCYLGRISYSLYMVHVFILHLVRAQDFLHPNVAVVVSVIGSLVAAHLLYAYVEEPARRFLTRVHSLRNIDTDHVARIAIRR
jgi:peptidoglycan/LPS O-acetylase OafA/YrhL